MLSLRGLPLALLVASALCMTGNFTSYLVGLRYIPPSTAQITMQLSPVFVLLGGLVIFRESFSRLQFIGFIVLFVGMVCFFNQRYGELTGERGPYVQGILIIAVSAFLWSSYSLAQKQLLNYLSGAAVLTAAYAIGIAVLFPFVHLDQLPELSRIHYILFAASVGLTLSSYLCFAEALKHLEASRTGVIVALTPLLTVVFATLAATLFTGYVEHDALNALALFGAALVVMGSICSSLGRK